MRMLPTLEEWKIHPFSEKQDVAEAIFRALPAGFSPAGIRRFTLGDQNLDVAQYIYGYSLFSFLPGGEFTLGYDESRAWAPNESELRNYDPGDTYGNADSIEGYIAEHTIRPHEAQIQPMLVEMMSSEEIGWNVASVSLDQLSESLNREFKKLKPCGIQRVYIGNTRLIVGAKTHLGELKLKEILPTTHSDIVQNFAAQGFRLPSSDEWEYACGAGVQTLFRWGDHASCDHDPHHSNSESELSWRIKLKATEASAPVIFPDNSVTSSWTIIQRPNLFGLRIAHDPYVMELTSDPCIIRGGDGGMRMCGGWSSFQTWQVLATAFSEKAQNRSPPILLHAGYDQVRRVFEL